MLQKEGRGERQVGLMVEQHVDDMLSLDNDEHASSRALKAQDQANLKNC
jgi:hypothetical protein